MTDTSAPLASRRRLPVSILIGTGLAVVIVAAAVLASSAVGGCTLRKDRAPKGNLQRGLESLIKSGKEE